MEQDKFSERMNDLLRISGCPSVTQFAKRIGLKRQTVDKYLSGKQKADMPSIQIICKNMNISSDWLLGLTDVQSQSADIQNAVNALGISEEAAKTIQEFDEFGKESLSWLIQFGSKEEIGFFEAWNEYLYSLSAAPYPNIRSNEEKRDKSGIDGTTEDGRIILDPKATTEYLSIIVERRFSRLCADLFDRFDFFDLKNNGRKKIWGGG